MTGAPLQALATSKGGSIFMRLIGKGRRATPLTIFVAVVAAILVSGGAYATAATVITGKQVKDSSLTGSDVKSPERGDSRARRAIPAPAA